jgi:hypothetical protein
VVRHAAAALACAAAGIDAIYAGEALLPDAVDLRGVPDWRKTLERALLRRPSAPT